MKALKGGRASLSWSFKAKAKQKFSYLLERSTNGRKFQSLGKFAGTRTQKLIDSGLKKGRSFFYRVRAFAKKKKTQWSATVMIKARA